MASSLRRQIGQLDWWLVFATFCTCGIGLVVLASAGYNHELGYSPTMHRQAVSFAMGVFAFVVCGLLGLSFWQRWSYLFYLLALVLLLLVLTKGIVAGGARRWVELGGFRLQPSELMKLGVILALARYFGGREMPEGGYSFFRLFQPVLLMLVPAVLILVQPDLGTAMALLLIGGSMSLMAGVRGGALVRLALIALVLIPIAWSFVLKDYQRQRVMTFVSPESDPLGSGYHAMQSKIAVGSGATFGKGFLQGTQTQLRFLPEQTTDFIFSVLAEEWGFVGSVGAIALYAFLVLRLLLVASRVDDPYTAFVVIGVAAMIFWHAVLNIGMVIGVVPVVGITLALLSYGGSSAITILASLGLVVGLTSRKYMFG